MADPPLLGLVSSSSPLGRWTAHRAATDPESADPALRGRTYAIPFDRVWSAIIAIADGGANGWRVLRADASEGVIEAESETRFRKRIDDVRIRIGLDDGGWTRVDLVSASRTNRADLGSNRRRIRDFLRRLDERLASTGNRTESVTNPRTQL